MSTEKKPKIDARKIVITRLVLDKFNVGYTSGQNELQEGLPVNFGVKIHFDSDFEHKGIGLGLNIRVTIADENSESSPQADLDIKAYLNFSITNLDELTVQDGGKNKLPKALGVTLLSLGFSTLRGVVFEKLSSTALSGFMLPVISPEELFDQYLESLSNEKT